MPYTKYQMLISGDNSQDHFPQVKSNTHTSLSDLYNDLARRRRNNIPFYDLDGLDEYRYAGAMFTRQPIPPTIYGVRYGYADGEKSNFEPKTYGSPGVLDHGVDYTFESPSDITSFPVTPVTPVFPPNSNNNNPYATGETLTSSNYQYQGNDGSYPTHGHYFASTAISSVAAAPTTCAPNRTPINLSLPPKNTEMVSSKAQKQDTLEKELTKLLCEPSNFYKDRQGKFRCPLCSNSYKYFKHLKRHCIGHTGERPHICEKCNYRFCRSDIKARHEKRCMGKVKDKDPIICNESPRPNNSYPIYADKASHIKVNGCISKSYNNCKAHTTHGWAKRDFSGYPFSATSGLMIYNPCSPNHGLSPPSSTGSVASENIIEVGPAKKGIVGGAVTGQIAQSDLKNPFQITYDNSYPNGALPMHAKPPESNIPEYSNSQALCTLKSAEQQIIPYNMPAPYCFADATTSK